MEDVLRMCVCVKMAKECVVVLIVVVVIKSFRWRRTIIDEMICER